jgi:hypothetical protein
MARRCTVPLGISINDGFSAICLEPMYDEMDEIMASFVLPNDIA